MNKKRRKEESIESKIIKKLLLKSLICVLLFILYLIFNKQSIGFKDTIYNNIYSSNISFAKINHWYESYFGSLFPIKTINEVQVFSESIAYKEKHKYEEGVLLKVSEKYIVPSINDGIIIYIGNKEKYGKTIIIADENGLDTWYSNINIGNVNIYDYVNKGDYLGEAIDGRLIMVFQKDGKYEDYEKYI